MRMITYLTAAIAVVAPALLLTAGLGILGLPDLHLKAGLLSAILTVGLHTLVILFMIVTGRILREAVSSRDLPQKFLDELNVFFASSSGYPAAVFGALSIAAAAILGYGASGLNLSPAVHMLAGLLALCVNMWAFSVEYGALRKNQVLVDRAANELDMIDRELEARGELPEDELPDPQALVRGALVLSITAWLPFIYWGMVVWGGSFEKVSIHPWLEISVVSFVVWLLGRRGLAASDSTAEAPAPPSS
ncbi:MAG: hypothetical protein ACI841_003680 [Planctomycetota bacterium]|jgi:hypothetical protein